MPYTNITKAIMMKALTSIMACMLKLNKGLWSLHLGDLQPHRLDKRHETNLA